MDEPSAGAPDTEADRDPEQVAIEVLERLLVEQGAMSFDELAAAFEAAEPTLAAELVASGPGALAQRVAGLVRGGEAFWGLGDGRVAAVLHHLRRATFTHRLTAGELDRGVLDVVPDLVALALPNTVLLPDGTELTTIGPDTDARAAETGSLVGPEGWLAGLEPGALVSLRYDGETAHLGRPSDDELADGGAAAAALDAAYRALPTSRAPEVHRVVVDAIGIDPAAFAAPVAPVAELLAAVGLRVRVAWVGPADRPWLTPTEQARRARADELLATADRCCQTAARRALDAWHAWLEADVEGATLRAEGAPNLRVAADIDHGPVAGVLAEVATAGRPGVTTVRLGRWAAACVETAKPGATLGGVEYLRALGEDAAGDALAAEARVTAALAREPDHAACLGFLAEFAADRGDAERSLALFRRTGREPSPALLSELGPFVVGRSVGRNEPCPCGSGRKYKACCSGRALRRPLPERARWLLLRAARYATRRNAVAARSLTSLFDTSNGSGGPERDAVAGLVADLLLFSEGGLAAYLAARGTLLADDELACAQAWVGAPMRVLELAEAGEAAGDAAGREVVDVASGERRTVAGLTPAAAGLVLTRPLPVGDTWIVSSAAIPVPEAARARAVALADTEIRPVHLLQFLFEAQLDAMGGLDALAGLAGGPGGRTDR